MKKRILSLLLAVFVLVAAMPFGTVMAEDVAVEDTTVSESGSTLPEINLTTPDFPSKVTTYKVANNFPDDADTFRAMCTGSAKTHSTDWDPGVIAAASQYAVVDGGTTIIENGVATFTEGESTGTFTVQLVLKSLVESDTNYVAVDVDASGIVDTTSKMTARFYMGTTTGGDLMYATAGQTYYFLPVATEDNPNPVMEARTMTSSSNDYDAKISVYPGEKGTFYFPETMFLASEGVANHNDLSASWITDGKGDFSKYMTDEWELYHSRRTSCAMYFSFRSCIPANNSIAFSNVRWMSETDFQLDYNAEYIAEDFSDAQTSSYTYWNGSGHTMSADNFEVADGVWKHNITAEDWTVEESTFRYGSTVSLDYPVAENFEAIQFDADYSAISTQPELQITYNVKNTDVSRSNYVRRFAVANGDVYAVWENGEVETIPVANNEWAWLYLPVGFKGTVVIPFATLRTMTHNGYTYDGTSVDLFKNDDINDYGLTIDMRNIPFADKGDVITYDNYGYLTVFDIDPVTEVGTTFNADAPIEVDNRIAEEINTIETWIKVPEGTAAGTIIADKYRVLDNTAVDTLVLNMNAAGNPVLYLSDGDGNSVNFVISDVDLRTNEWTHIAFAKTETTLSFYINGILKESVTLPEGFGEVKPYHVLTIGHYIHEELGGATFGGEIANLKLWNKTLASTGIITSATSEATNEEGLIAAWTLNGDNALADVAGNYNLEVYDLYTTSEDEDYAEFDSIPEDGYTFVVLPDTQIAAYREAMKNVGTYTEFTGMYDWIIENKEDKNIQFVMGVGDITDKDDPAEYTLAKSNFDRLTAAGIPWSVVGGNHDFNKGNVSPYNTTNLNTYFPASELSTLAGFGGFMKSTEMDNSYYYVTVNETKYLILNLCCEPDNAALEWANQVCAKNKDCKIIVVTHEYLNRDAKLRTSGYTGRNQGMDIWNKLVSQHENIIMAVGGHVAVADIQYEEVYGVNGNKVINVLVDGQALDWDPTHNMVMLLKFSADGSEVTFDYYSTAKDAYLDANNHFTLEVGGVVSDESLPAAPKADYNYSKFYNGEIIRDYEWFINDGKALSNWSDSKQSTVSEANFSWYNNMVKFTAPAEFKVNPNTVTEENPEGTRYESDRVGITFGKLPNVTNENQTAVSIYVDRSTATDSEYVGLRLRYNNGSQAFRTNKGSVVYLVDVDGNVTKSTCTSTHATVYIPSGFKGNVIVPFTSFQFDDGSGNFATAADMLKETQSNNSHLVVYILNAKPSQEYIFNNVTYLDEYHAEDLVALRNGLMDAENGKLVDVNGDKAINATDIVRLKKVLADFYVK